MGKIPAVLISKSTQNQPFSFRSAARHNAKPLNTSSHAASITKTTAQTVEMSVVFIFNPPCYLCL